MKAFIYQNSKWGMLLLAGTLLLLASLVPPEKDISRFYLILALLSSFGALVNHVLMSKE